jgi:hypothetical protein
MNDLSNVENARAASEARESVVSAHPSSSAAAVAAAMRRYLRSEQYHELRAGEGPPAGEQDPAEPAG